MTMTSTPYERWLASAYLEEGSRMGVEYMLFSMYSKLSPFKRGILVVLRWLSIRNLLRQFSLLPGRSF